MLRSDLRAAVINNAGGRSDKDTVINQGLDLGLKELTKLYDFKDLWTESDLTTTASVAYVTLPSTMSNLVEVRLINGTQSYPIAIKSKVWMVERWANISANNETFPSMGYEEGGLFYLFPVPDDAYTIRVTTVGEPADFAGDSTENPVPILDYSLICWASAFLFDSLEQFDRGTMWKQRAERALRLAVSREKKTRKIYQHSDRRSGLVENDRYPYIEPYKDPFARSDYGT